MEGDSEANYAYYALHKLKIRPRDFNEMDIYEKAFVITAIDIKIENEKKEEAKIKK
ncbi:MAG: hypothetical protein GX053_14510 [Tissierella sp.]|nr:hypothetical protein [Tissierella sp.]